MKLILKFDGYEERDEFNDAVNGGKYKSQVEEIWQCLFRGRHKHGYNDDLINQLLGIHNADDADTPEQIACNALMDRLELLYHDIVKDN